MLEKTAQSSELAALLVISSKFERDPLPFRLQPNLQITIPLEEYAKFCETELQTSFLFCPYLEMQSISAKYRLDPNSNREKLFSYFSRDVSFAILKEIYYAELTGKECTKIIHSVEGKSESYGKETISKIYTDVSPNISPILINHMRSRGYNFRGIPSNKNLRLFEYAVVLFFLASTEIVWSYL